MPLSTSKRAMVLLFTLTPCLHAQGRVEARRVGDAWVWWLPNSTKRECIVTYAFVDSTTKSATAKADINIAKAIAAIAGKLLKVPVNLSGGVTATATRIERAATSERSNYLASLCLQTLTGAVDYETYSKIVVEVYRLGVCHMFAALCVDATQRPPSVVAAASQRRKRPKPPTSEQLTPRSEAFTRGTYLVRYAYDSVLSGVGRPTDVRDSTRSVVVDATQGQLSGLSSITVIVPDRAKRAVLLIHDPFPQTLDLLSPPPTSRTRISVKHRGADRFLTICLVNTCPEIDAVVRIYIAGLPVLHVGDSAQIDVYGPDDKKLPMDSVTISIEPSGFADVDAAKAICARTPGRATVIATYEGTRTTTALLVLPLPKLSPADIGLAVDSLLRLFRSTNIDQLRRLYLDPVQDSVRFTSLVATISGANNIRLSGSPHEAAADELANESPPSVSLRRTLELQYQTLRKEVVLQLTVTFIRVGERWAIQKFKVT